MYVHTVHYTDVCMYIKYVGLMGRCALASHTHHTTHLSTQLLHADGAILQVVSFNVSGLKEGRCRVNKKTVLGCAQQPYTVHHYNKGPEGSKIAFMWVCTYVSHIFEKGNIRITG